MPLNLTPEEERIAIEALHKCNEADEMCRQCRQMGFDVGAEEATVAALRRKIEAIRTLAGQGRPQQR